MLPSASQATTTTRMPAITALAAFVPCALDGIRHTSRSAAPFARWYARIASSPANSPCEPAFGCRLTASYPVTSASQRFRSSMSRRYPPTCTSGANGCTWANSGQLIGSISAVALSFIVQEPSGIMPRSSA